MPDGTAPAPPWARHAIQLLALSPRIASLSKREREGLGSIGEKDLQELARVKLDSLFYLACQPNAPRQRLYDAAWRVERAALLELIGALDVAGVRSLVFKGAEHIERWYGSRPLSLMADVDILVDRASLVEVQRVLFTLGFRPAGFVLGEGLVDRDIADIAEIEANHYQLPPFVRLTDLDADKEALAHAAAVGENPIYQAEDRVVLLLQLDVHHKVASDVDTEQFFERAVPSALGIGATLSAADHVWFTLSRLYVEVALHGKRSLRDFAYLLPLVAGSAVDWSVVLEQASTMELRPHLYYFLSFMNDLVEGVVPEDVLAELAPTRGARDYDFGWQLGKLLGTIDRSPVPGLRAEDASRLLAQPVKPGSTSPLSQP